VRGVGYGAVTFHPNGVIARSAATRRSGIRAEKLHGFASLAMTDGKEWSTSVVLASKRYRIGTRFAHQMMLIFMPA
jgi:hypothetical protein